MAASSSALAWPTADGSGAGGAGGATTARRGDGVFRARPGEKIKRVRGFVVPVDGVQPRVDGACGWRFAELDGNPDRRAGVGRAAGAGDAGLDIERIDAAGLFERVQAGIAHAFEKRRIGIEQAVEPVDHHAGRQEIEQQPCRACFRRAPAVRARRARSAAAADGSGASACTGGATTACWRFGRVRRFRARRFRSLALPTIGGRVRRRRCFRPASAPESAFRRADGTGRRSARSPALPGGRWAFPPAFPDRLMVLCLTKEQKKSMRSN